VQGATKAIWPGSLGVGARQQFLILRAVQRS
jgi:hypothetical protein